MGKLTFHLNDLKLELDLFEDIYEPLEDTILISKNIPKNLKGKKVLDLGCGSGILSVLSAKYNADVTSVDINPDAVDNTKHNAEKYNLKIKAFQSDLFYKVRGKFDLILFNPPYVPSDEHDKYLSKGIHYATTSGKDGADLIERFLKEFKKYLKPKGKVLMIISSHNKIKNRLEKSGWKEIDSGSFFFEKIYLMEY